jgi:hypothetical protein
MGTMEPPAAPSWQNRMNTAGSAVIISVLPVGWEGFWHENPKPQRIVPLSGRWFVETMDGKRVEMGTSLRHCRQRAGRAHGCANGV